MELGRHSGGFAVIKKVLGAVSRRQWRQLGIDDRADRRDFAVALLRDVIDNWREKHQDAPELRAESDTPWLDFIRDLVDAGKIKEFLAFLFEQLPKLIKAIIDIFA